MDDTQQLVWNCEEQEEEQGGSEREPRARLRMFGGSKQAKTDFTIYGGLNVIGRNENCDICIPVQSVSKKHAVIDVEGDTHVIHDCNSLNKTRRKSVILKPHIRYQINDGDVFLFGDVACQYLVLPPEAQGIESGSDTDSESMLPQSRASMEYRVESHPIPESAGKDLEWADNSLILSPTPSYKRRLPEKLVQANVYVKDSEDDDTPWKESRAFTSQAASISVLQTPSANVVPESDDEAENTSHSNLQSASLHYHSDTDLEEDQKPGEEHTTVQPAHTIVPHSEMGQDPALATGETVLNGLSGSEGMTTKEPGKEDNGADSSKEPVSQPSAEVNGTNDTDADDDMNDFYALQPTQCFVLSVSSTQDETAAEEKWTTPGEPVTAHSLEEDATQPFILPTSVFSREPCQEAFASDSDHRRQLGEATGSPGEESITEAETDMTGSMLLEGPEPRELDGLEAQGLERPEADVEIQASLGREQAVEVERVAEAGAALVLAAADLAPFPANTPPRDEGGDCEEAPAATGLSEALSARERVSCQQEMEGVKSQGSLECQEPGEEAFDPGTDENSRAGVRRSSRKSRAAELKSSDGSWGDVVVPQEHSRQCSSGLVGSGEDRSREARENVRCTRRTRTQKPSAQGKVEETSAKAMLAVELEMKQTPARPRRGKGRQRNSLQTTGNDHLGSPQQSPLIAPKARAKRRSVADPQNRPESESPPKKRPATGRDVSSQDGQETGSSSGQSRRSRVASQAGSEKGTSTSTRVKTRRQACQLSPSPSGASLSESVSMSKEDGQERGSSSARSRRSRASSEAGSELGANTSTRVKTRRQACQLSPSPSGASLSESVPMPKVMFTGLVDEDGMKVIELLGGEVVECVHDSTHLVTDRIRRTVKFLCAVARGIPVVTPEWLKKSGRNSYFLSYRSFLLDDRDQEQNFNFKLKDSLQKAKEQPLLQNYRIHVTAGVQPDPSQMWTILRCSGATVLPKMPRTYKEKTLVISCPDDLAKCKAARDAGIPVVNAEFVLTGILQQTVDLVKHRLDGDKTSKAEAQERKRGSARPASAKKKY
ncbi:mediator of DNA damage checkpoint protein 1 isoform X2 [Narcine bancroftii]|uniref:mediator of DNA damage checkpoint protein 1 isoform X2 n=1 Tax=Narcine bancroftii TaxID=1343680 RepID=UPI003831A813